MIAVDLFAGCGGSTTGAVAAGARVVWAANHWDRAVKVHRDNHPDTLHACQDLQQADFSQVPDHDLLMASPSCQGHAKARGKDLPRHDAARSTAWAVISCAEVKRPATIVVENVPEFRSWTLYPAWRQALFALGYVASENLINAADCGVPQSRVRLFIVATRSRAPIEIKLSSMARVGAETVINLDKGCWSAVDRPGRAARTLERIAAARAGGARRFLLAYYGSERAGRSLVEPMGTLTTRDRFAIVDGDRMRMLMVPEVKAGMGFPPGYTLPTDHKDAVMMLGNAVCPPVMRRVVRYLRRFA